MQVDIYKQDRFFVDLQSDRIIWMYHNPDAVSGDQFVSNVFDSDLLKEAVEKNPIGAATGFEPYGVFDYIAENCRQYLSDVGMESYNADKERFESTPISIGMTHTTLDMLDYIFKAKEYINNYSKEEFNSYADFSDLKQIGIGYTTTEDGKHELQAYANLIDYQTEVYVDGQLVTTGHSESLKDYVENRLFNLDFNDLFDIPDWVLDGAENPYEKVKMMHFKLYGYDYDVCIEVGTYLRGGGLCIQLHNLSEGELEPFARITTNLTDYVPAPGCAFVDTNNVEPIQKLVQQYKLGKPTGRIGQSGYCYYPEYRFDMQEIKKYCINPEDIPAQKKPKNKERGEAR